MARFDKVLLVANPTSGLGKARRWFDRAAEAIRPLGRELEVLVTQAAGDARTAVAELGSGRNLAVAFGGDGTVHELLNGADLDSGALAVIPAGTGNVLAKELGMAAHPTRSVRQLLNGRLVSFDVGVCNGRRFISMFGAGLDARAVELVHRNRGKTLTQVHYLPHIVRAVLSVGNLRVAAEADDRTLVRSASQVCVGNTHSYGGPIEMTPAAAPDDGLLDVMAFRLRGPGDLLHVGACVLLRALHVSRRATYRRARRVMVWSPEGRVPYELDGEAAGELPAAITLQPRAVRLLAPRSFRHIQRKPPREEAGRELE